MGNAQASLYGSTGATTVNKIENEYYWLERMIQARITGNDHQTIFHTDIKTWNHIQETQRCILQRLIPNEATVIDVGCGAGFLLECMPPGVTYFGIDLNPYLIEWARRKYESKENASFEIMDAKDITAVETGKYDWSVSRSVVGCCGKFAGYDVAAAIRNETIRVAKHSVFLGYDPADQFTFGDDDSHPLTLGTL
jgi:SAM-dependent methyltransferase